MKPRCAIGSGMPPRYVSHFVRQPDGSGAIHLAGGELNEEAISFSSHPDLLKKCRKLLERRILFSVGGHVQGAADEMTTWQINGSLADSFLQISWKRPGEWIIHEIVPGAIPPWEFVQLAALVA